MTFKQDVKAELTRLKSARHYFELLGVHKGSSVEEVGEARRRLALLVHPDRLAAHRHPEDRRNYMADINHAHDVLTTKARRTMYLAELAAGRSKCPACSGGGCKRVQRGFKNVTFTACDVCGGAGLA